MEPRVHHNREDLTGEHWFGDAGQALFAVAFVAVWILDTSVLHWTTMLDQYVPDWVQTILAAILLASAAILALASLRTVFGEVRDPPVVIRTGLFAYLRHPVYFSEVLFYVGLLVFRLSLAAAIVAVGAIVFLRMLCRYEERLLVDRFGDEYREYMGEVPMWIPRIRRRGNRKS